MKVKVKAKLDINAEVGTYKFKAAEGEICEFSIAQAEIGVSNGWFDEVAESVSKSFDKMNKAELLAEAEKMGLVVEESATKAQIIELLKTE